MGMTPGAGEERGGRGRWHVQCVVPLCSRDETHPSNTRAQLRMKGESLATHGSDPNKRKVVPCGATTDERGRTRPSLAGQIPAAWELGAGNWFGRNDHRTQFDPVDPVYYARIAPHASMLHAFTLHASHLVPHASC